MGTERKAVVIGGSIAGLFAAAALSERFDQVEVLDRDALPEGPHAHQGVPQGRHIHLLLPIGLQKACEMVAGLDRLLTDAGCPTIDFCASLGAAGPAGWSARAESGVPVMCFTRPLFEWVVRQTIRDRPQITIRQANVVGLDATGDGRRVTGVRAKGDGDETIVADLVVDASGRGSKSTKWLRELGYDAPAEQHVRVYMGYTSQIVRIPDGLLPAGLAGVGATPHPPTQFHGGAFAPVEDGKHLLVAAGMMRHYPPRDREGVIEFLKHLPTPLVAECAAEFEWLTEPTSYHMPGNQRRMWEDMERRPESFVVLGDAVASFNPVYGQGMTQAILAATTLREQLAARDGDLDGFARDFQEALRPSTDAAFGAAGGSDAFFDGAEREGFEAPDPAGLEFFEDLAALATQDAEVAIACSRMYGYLDESAVMTESITAKVEAWVAAGRPMTRNTDLSVLPDLAAAPV